MNELQAIVTGMLMGALSGQQHVSLTVVPEVDERGNYLPEFTVLGNVTLTKLRVTIEVEEIGGEE